MNLLTQLLLQPLPAPCQAPASEPRVFAVDLYGPHLRGQGLVSGTALQRLTGRSACAVNDAMRKTLIPKGYVKKHERQRGQQRYYVYEWVGK